jgi:hypothetical protein
MARAKTAMAKLLTFLLARVLPRPPAAAYRPELHYMRGPGPKCRAKDLARA